jgi:hypothetical protein
LANDRLTAIAATSALASPVITITLRRIRVGAVGPVRPAAASSDSTAISGMRITAAI